VTKTLKSGDKLTLVGFGTFSFLREQPAKAATHSGEEIKIKAKKVASLRQRLSGKL